MRLLGVLLLAAALGGCVAPIDPRPAVAELSEATKTAQTALRDYDREIAAYRTNQVRARALAEPIRVQAAADTCVEGATACRIVVPLGGNRFSDLYVVSALDNHLAAIEEISLYMETLTALAAAESDADLAAAADRAASSVAKIAALASVAVPGAAAIVPLAQPVGRAVAWVAGQAREQAKLVALRDATARMQSVLDKATKSFAEVADAAHGIKVRMSLDATIAALGRFNANGGTDNLASLVKAAAATDAMAAASPGKLFLDLNDAHKALADALAAPVFSRENVRAAVTKMKTESKRVAQIVQALRDATPQS